MVLLYRKASYRSRREGGFNILVRVPSASKDKLAVKNLTAGFSVQQAL